MESNKISRTSLGLTWQLLGMS